MWLSRDDFYLHYRREIRKKGVEFSNPKELGFCPNRLQNAESLIGDEIKKGQFAGAVTLVSRRGKVALFNSHGYADLANKVPMREDTLFRIYSMTKIISSVALMILYERGQIDLNDPVSKYIPSFSNQRVKDAADQFSPALRPTRIYDLLRHCGGLAPVAPIEDLLRSDHTLESLANLVGRAPLIAQPDTRWVYGSSTDVLARVVEVVSGTRFDDFLANEIFQPLGMSDTGFELAPDKASRLAICYRCDEEGQLFEIDGNKPDSLFARKKTLLSASGGLIASTRDFLRFATMLLNKGVLGGVQILGRKTIELMTLDHLPVGHPNLEIGTQSFRFGLGVSVVTDVARSRCLSSTGEYGWGGAAGTQVWINPEEEMIVIIMTQVRSEVPTGTRDVYKRMVYQALVD